MGELYVSSDAWHNIPQNKPRSKKNIQLVSIGFLGAFEASEAMDQDLASFVGKLQVSNVDGSCEVTWYDARGGEFVHENVT